MNQIKDTNTVKLRQVATNKYISFSKIEYKIIFLGTVVQVVVNPN